MSREPESTSWKVLRFTFIVLLLPIILPLAIVGLVLHFLNKVVVYLLVWVWWLPRGKDVLYVSSDSPIWKEYMETEIFPLIAERAVVLSWSARSKWRSGLSPFEFSARLAVDGISIPWSYCFALFALQGFFAFYPLFKNASTGTMPASNGYATI